MTLQEERKRQIIYELDNYGKVSVQALAKKFCVTTETIRRDLDAMEVACKLKRIHGGAVKISFDHIEPSHVQRKEVFRLEKQKIGMKAARMVQDHEIVAIDTGTTTCEILPHLWGRKNLTLLLNSVAALNLVIELRNSKGFDGKIIFLGGEINTDQMSCFGPISEKILTDFYVDKAFIAVGGISIQNGLTGYDINEASLSHAIMKHAKEVIVVADHSKIGVRNFYKISELQDVDVIISNTAAPAEWEEHLNSMEIEWLVA